MSLAKILDWFLMSPMNSTCPPHLTLLHFVTMRLSTEQYTSSLQFSTSPNDSKHQQVKNFTKAVQHFWCIHSPLSNHLHNHKDTQKQYIVTFPSTGFVVKILAMLNNYWVYTQAASRSQCKVPCILTSFDKYHNTSPHYSVTAVPAI